MKVSKIFGCVLGLHACLIAVLVVQPGCQSTQPPTQTYRQDRSSPAADRSVPSTGSRAAVPGAARTQDGLIPAGRRGGDDGIDPAFNAGFEDERYAPRGDFEEFDSVEPLEPLRSGAPQEVDVAGASFETYTVKKGDSLWAISRRYDVSVNELYEANGLSKSSVLRVGQQVKIPVEGSTETVDPVTADSYQPTRMDQPTEEYKVRRGDALSRIARRYDTTVNAIKAANGKSSDMIRVGETLVIPVGENAEGSSAPSASSSADSDASSASSASNRGASVSGTHVVRSGEYPATIARKYGMTTGELLGANGITDPRKLQVGQRLKVSGTGNASNVDSRTETVASPEPEQPSASRQLRANDPMEIRLIEADPLVEGEFEPIAVEPAAESASAGDDEEDPFDDAVEIPVIRLEE